MDNAAERRQRVRRYYARRTWYAVIRDVRARLVDADGFDAVDALDRLSRSECELLVAHELAR